MTASSILMMIIVLGIFWGGFASLILRLKKVSDNGSEK